MCVYMCISMFQLFIFMYLYTRYPTRTTMLQGCYELFTGLRVKNLQEHEFWLVEVDIGLHNYPYRLDVYWKHMILWLWNHKILEAATA